MNSFSKVNMKVLSLIFVTFIFVSCAHKSPSVSSEKRESQADLEKLAIQAKNHPTLKNQLEIDWFMKAMHYFYLSEFDSAEKYFEVLDTLNSTDIFLQRKHALNLIRGAQFEKARTVLTKLYDQTRDEKIGLILAGLELGLDHPKEAEKRFKQLLARHPGSEESCLSLAKFYLESQRIPKAQKLLTSCGEKNKKSGHFDFYLAKISLEKGFETQALEYLKSSHRKDPKNLQTTSALGILYEELDQPEQAIKIYQRYLTFDPDESAILSRMVQVLFVQERYQEVLPYAERLSDLDPENLNLKIKLGILYSDTKKFDEALVIFQELLKVSPDSDKLLYYVGAIYQELGQWQKSMDFYGRITPASGLYSDSSLQVANMLSTVAEADFFEKKQSEAREDFINFVNLRLEQLPDLRTELSVVKAGYYESIGEYKAALDVMVVVQDEKDFSLQHKYYLANLYEKQKRFAESSELMLALIKENPKNEHAWNFLGYTLLLRGDEEKAFEYIQKAFKLNPKDGYIRDSLGWYYFKKGEYKKALKELELAQNFVPDDIEILKHLAELHQTLRNFDKAVFYYQAAMKNSKSRIEQEELRLALERFEQSRLPASENKK